MSNRWSTRLAQFIVLALLLKTSFLYGQAAKAQPKQNAKSKSTALPSKKIKPVAPVSNIPTNGVRDVFAKSLQLIQENKTDDAILSLEQLLRQFPDYQPALIQYARLLYSRDRIPEAYQAFTRVNPVGLEVDVSYEYAMSHFWMRQYEQALYGFRRVPDGHALFDLANYYGAISALKLRRLVDAETMMEKAVVLPDALARSRKNYLQHIRELKYLLEKQGMAEETEREKKKIEENIRKEQPVRLTQRQTRQAESGHRGFEIVDVFPLLGGKYKRQVNDDHGYATETAEISDVYFEFRGGKLFTLPYGVGRDHAAIGLVVNGKADEEVRTGQEKRRVESEDLEGAELIVNADSTRRVSRYGSVAAGGWVEFPTPMKVWFAFGGRYMRRFPDFEALNRTGTAEGFFQLGSKELRREFVARYTYSEISNKDNLRTQQQHTVKFLWHFPIAYTFYLDAELLHNNFLYDDEQIDGPTSATSFSPDLYYELPLGISLGLKVNGIYQSDYVFHNVPTFGEVSADGQTIQGKPYILVEPWTWLTFKISETSGYTKWTVRPEEAQTVFEESHADYQEEFETSLAINLLF